LIDELQKAQLTIVEGTLYPLLNRLKNANLASYKWVESDAGPPRKYYSITPEGLEFLDELNKTWENLGTSVNQIIMRAKNK
jgi:PadR family transcriptional regulator PadR